MLQAASRQQCTGRWPIAALPSAVGAAAVVVDDVAGGRGVAGADGRQGHGAAAQAGAAKEDFVVARV